MGLATANRFGWNGNPDFTLAPDYWGTRARDCAGLTYAYRGGPAYQSNGVRSVVADGTVVLTASVTNYVERFWDGSVIRATTTGFTGGGWKRMAVVPTGVSTITDTAIVDHRFIGGEGVEYPPMSYEGTTVQDTTWPYFTPERYGAKADGITDDILAIYRACYAAYLAGGGTVAFRALTYFVFTQGTYWLALLGDMTGVPMRILGNGAYLKADPNMTWLRNAVTDWGYRAAGTVGLTAGYSGGTVLTTALNLSVLPNATILLADASTNYVEYHAKTGAVQTNTAGFSGGNFYPMFTAVTAAGAITSTTDLRNSIQTGSLFNFTACPFVEVTGFTYTARAVDMDATTPSAVGYAGREFVRLNDGASAGCTNVSVHDCTLSNMLAGVVALNAPLTNTIDVARLVMTNVYYGCEFANMGGKFRAQYTINGNHRAFVFDSSHNWSADVTAINSRAQSSWSYTNNTVLKYSSSGSTTAANFPLIRRQVTSNIIGNNHNNTLIADVDYGTTDPAVTGHGGALLYFFKALSDQVTPDVLDRGHSDTGIYITGVVKGIPQGDVPVIYAPPGCTWGPGETWKGWKWDIQVPDSWIDMPGDPIKDVWDLSNMDGGRALRIRQGGNVSAPSNFAKLNLLGTKAANLYAYITPAFIGAGGGAGGSEAYPLAFQQVGGTAVSLPASADGQTYTNKLASAAQVVSLPSAQVGMRLKFMRSVAQILDLSPLFSTTAAGSARVISSVLTTTVGDAMVIGDTYFFPNDPAGFGVGDTVVVGGETLTILAIVSCTRAGGARADTVFQVGAMAAGHASGVAITRSHTIRGGAAGQTLRMASTGAAIALECHTAGIWEILNQRGSITDTSAVAWP